MFTFFQMQDNESKTFTYIIACNSTNQIVIIDPVIELYDKYKQHIIDNGYKLEYICDTHLHADHVTCAHKLRENFGGQIVISAKAGINTADIAAQDGQLISFGNNLTIKCLQTPGHTSHDMCYFFFDRIFTGDCLLINGCGRTDFQDGSSEIMWHSIHDKIFSLPGSTLIFPGHDYNGKTVSTVFQEKNTNQRFAGKTLIEFTKLMANLNLPKPKKIDEALKYNLVSGKI